MECIFCQNYRNVFSELYTKKIEYDLSVVVKMTTVLFYHVHNLSHINFELIQLILHDTYLIRPVDYHDSQI